MKRICTALAFAFFVALFAGCGEASSTKATTDTPGKTQGAPGAPPPPPPPPPPPK